MLGILPADDCCPESVGHPGGGGGNPLPPLIHAFSFYELKIDDSSNTCDGMHVFPSRI
jgi:hypothetical protein